MRKLIRFGSKLIAFAKYKLSVWRREWIKAYKRHVICKSLIKPIKEKTVLYDAFLGLGILDSPRAIFKRLLEREEFKDYVHIFTVSNKKISKENLDEYSKLSNLLFVKRDSKKYIDYLHTAKYVISNSTVPPYYVRKENQVYLNTWHGVPLKIMGYERTGNRVISTENVVRNFLNATHLIGVNDFTISCMYKKAYLLDGIYEGIMIKEPLPRAELLINTEKSYVIQKLKQAGFNTEKKIIVYAPTWRGATYKKVKLSVSQLTTAVKRICNTIDTDVYQVYLRVHYFLYKAIKADREMRELCIPFTIDTNELLSVTDILITDFSSIFFDFLTTRKPILFYIPDLEDYVGSRGIYIPMDEMPGPVTSEIPIIAEHIRNIESTHITYRTKYETMRNWCISIDEIGACDRVIDTVFLGKDTVKANLMNDKKKVLIMADWNTNFYGQAFLSDLFEQIDYEKYDITLLTGSTKGNQRKLLEDLNRNVRILVNNKNMTSSISIRKRVFKALYEGKISLEEASCNLNMEIEWKRLVGCGRFDLCIQFQPTVSYCNWLLLGYVAPVENKILFKSYTYFPKTLSEDKYKYCDIETYEYDCITKYFFENH